jgi:hypothetical protein
MISALCILGSVVWLLSVVQNIIYVSTVLYSQG